MSLLKAHKTNNSHALNSEPINIQYELTYEEKLVKIVNSKFLELRNKKVKLVKVIWRNQDVKEATWKLEEAMRKATQSCSPIIIPRTESFKEGRM